MLRASSSVAIAKTQPESFIARIATKMRKKRDAHTWENPRRRWNFSTTSFQLSGSRAGLVILVFCSPPLSSPSLFVTPKRNVHYSAVIHLFEFWARIARFFHMVVRYPKKLAASLRGSRGNSRASRLSHAVYVDDVDRWRSAKTLHTRTGRPLVRAIACFMRPHIILTSSPTSYFIRNFRCTNGRNAI